MSAEVTSTTTTTDNVEILRPLKRKASGDSVESVAPPRMEMVDSINKEILLESILPVETSDVSFDDLRKSFKIVVDGNFGSGVIEFITYLEENFSEVFKAVPTHIDRFRSECPDLLDRHHWIPQQSPFLYNLATLNHFVHESDAMADYVEKTQVWPRSIKSIRYGFYIPQDDAEEQIFDDTYKILCQACPFASAADLIIYFESDVDRCDERVKQDRTIAQGERVVDCLNATDVQLDEFYEADEPTELSIFSRYPNERFHLWKLYIDDARISDKNDVFESLAWKIIRKFLTVRNSE